MFGGIMKTDNVILDKSKVFAIKIINIYKRLCDSKKEYVLSKQLLRSGTSIGANIREAIRGQSKADFIHKMNISLKEASETEYWLELLFAADYLIKDEYAHIYCECQEITKILMAIVKTSRMDNSQ